MLFTREPCRASNPTILTLSRHAPATCKHTQHSDRDDSKHTQHSDNLWNNQLQHAALASVACIRLRPSVQQQFGQSVMAGMNSPVQGSPSRSVVSDPPEPHPGPQQLMCDSCVAKKSCNVQWCEALLSLFAAWICPCDAPAITTRHRE